MQRDQGPASWYMRHEILLKLTLHRFISDNLWVINADVRFNKNTRGTSSTGVTRATGATQSESWKTGTRFLAANRVAATPRRHHAAMTFPLQTNRRAGKQWRLWFVDLRGRGGTGSIFQDRQYRIDSEVGGSCALWGTAKVITCFVIVGHGRATDVNKEWSRYSSVITGKCAYLLVTLRAVCPCCGVLILTVRRQSVTCWCSW